MFIQKADFIGSFTKMNQLPEHQLPEFAFIGRSNVGKSSLINYLTGRKALAKVSHTPGKTQTINYFLIDEAWYLVDLPGYGYAKVSKKQREAWEKMISAYLRKSPNLLYVFQLVDSRIPPQQNDLDFTNWLGENEIPFVIVYTKMDNPKKKENQNNIKAYRKTLSKTWMQLPPDYVTSSAKDVGREELLNFINQMSQTFGGLI